MYIEEHEIDYEMCWSQLEDKLFDYHDVACQEQYAPSEEGYKMASFKKLLIEQLQKDMREIEKANATPSRF